MCLSASLKTKLFCESARLSSTFELDNVKNEAISARLPQFLKLATSKTKQFCETAFNNGKLSAELTASCQCVLRFFQPMSLKYCARHEKVRPGRSYKVLHLPPANASENATKPSHFTSLLARCTIPCACHAKRHCNFQKWSGPLVFLTF